MMTGQLRCGDEYQDLVFDALQQAKSCVRDCEFVQCQFRGCDFAAATLVGCRFIDCDFYDCNFNVVRFERCTMRCCQFQGCNVTGVNWTRLDWRSVNLAAPLSFIQCDLSYSVFQRLALPQLLLHECIVHEVDFSECDLTAADFHSSDLAGAFFRHTKLDKCNFQQAYNFAIDPTQNSVTAARFSSPEVLNLLAAFRIKVDCD